VRHIGMFIGGMFIGGITPIWCKHIIIMCIIFIMFIAFTSSCASGAVCRRNTETSVP